MTSTILLESEFAQHVCGFAHTVADAEVYTPSGELHYAFGRGFNRLVKLEDIETLAGFGIQRIWFSRYFKRGAELPTLTLGQTRHIVQSQVQVAVDVMDASGELTPAQHDALLAHILNHLPVTEAEIDSIAIKTDKTCCHSPCFGCTVFDVNRAIEAQGKTPWLEILEAQAQQQQTEVTHCAKP
jgi:hypothetical protein